MRQSLGLLYGILSSATFGLIPLFTLPLIESGMDMQSILFFRFAISAVLMLAVAKLQKKSLKLSFREFVTLVFLGLCYAATAAMLIHSYEYLSSGMATTIHFLYPVVVALVMTIFFKEPSSFRLFAGIIMAVSGVVMLCSVGGFGNLSITGLTLALSTTVTYALYIVGTGRTCAASLDGHVVTFYVLLFGAFIFGITTLHSEAWIDLPETKSDIINLALLALIPTLVSDLTLVLAIQRIGSTATAVLGALEPLTAVLIGVFVFGEAMTALSVSGIVMIIAAVTLVILSTKRR